MLSLVLILFCCFYILPLFVGISVVILSSSHQLQNLSVFWSVRGSVSFSVDLSVESLLVILSWTGHLSEQLSLTLRDSLIHTVQLKPSPVINYTFWTCSQRNSHKNITVFTCLNQTFNRHSSVMSDLNISCYFFFFLNKSTSE